MTRFELKEDEGVVSFVNIRVQVVYRSSIAQVSKYM